MIQRMKARLAKIETAMRPAAGSKTLTVIRVGDREAVDSRGKLYSGADLDKLKADGWALTIVELPDNGRDRTLESA